MICLDALGSQPPHLIRSFASEDAIDGFESEEQSTGRHVTGSSHERSERMSELLGSESVSKKRGLEFFFFLLSHR